MSDPVSEKTRRRWAESLAGLARTGMGFTESQYERERYEEILNIAGDIKAAADHGMHDVLDAQGHVVEWMKQIGKGIPGYVTPKVSVGAAVSNEKGELLLIQRADSGFWLYPTGWCDVGYSAPEVVVKEVQEETGYEVEPIRLIGILDGMRLGASRVPLYSMLFLCKLTGGSMNIHELECTDAGWFTRDNLPSPLIGAERWVDHVFSAIEGEKRDVYYDELRVPVWRNEE